MCIAIYKPAGKWVSKEELRTSYENNPHGAGFAFHNGTRVVVEKGFFTFRSFWKAYKRVVTNETPAFAHFRIATSGKKDEVGCHPFNIPGGVLMHNGPCLNRDRCKGDSERSDTQQFAEDFVAGLNAVQVQRLKPMIEDFAGTEKVIFMFDSGEVIICNEKQGHWHNGCWFSNDGYQKYDRYDWGTWYEKKENKAPLTFTPDKPVYVFSYELQTSLPKYVTDTFGIELEWCREFQAYIPFSTSDDAMADDDYVYDFGFDGEVEITGQVIHSIEELELFLMDTADGLCHDPEFASADFTLERIN